MTNKSDHRRAAGKRFDLTNGSPLREYNRYTDYPSVIPEPFRGSGIEAVCPLFDRVYAIIFRVIRTAATAGLNPPLTVAAKRILTKFHSESDAVRKKRSNARARRGKKNNKQEKKDGERSAVYVERTSVKSRDDREKVYRYEALFRSSFQGSRDAAADEGGGVPGGVPGHVVLLLILILVKEVEKLEGWHEEG